METITRFTRIITFLVIIIIGMSIYLVATSFYSETAEEDRFFCGTVDPINELIDNKVNYRHSANYIGNDFNPTKGRQLFNAECASCHSLKEDAIILGPSLNNVFARIPNDHNWIFTYLKNQDSLLKKKDIYTVALKQEFNDIDWRHSQSNLTDQDLIDLVGFIGMIR